MSNNHHSTLADDEESYYSEEEVTCTEDDDDDDFEFKDLEKEIYGRMGGPPPDVLKAMGKKAPTPSPVIDEQPKRPPHPLMGGGSGGKNPLLEQVKARGATPPAAVGSGNSNKENVSPPSMPKRPPHPLMGGGGGNPLLDQIKARGAIPPSTQGSGAKSDAAVSAVASKPKPPPPPPPSKPLAQMSMAEQVAAMAAKRQQRLEAGASAQSNNEETEPPKSAVLAAPTETPATNNTPMAIKSITIAKTTPAVVPTTQPVVHSVEAKKSGRSGGIFGGGKKKTEETTVVAPSKPIRVVTKTPPAVTPVVSVPAEEEVTIIKTYKPEPLPLPPKKTIPVFAQAKLKPVSRGPENDMNNVTTTEPITTTTAITSTDVVAPVGEEMSLPKARTTTTTTTTTTITKTKRITKSDPEYDVTEYKVGCACTVM